MDINISGPKDSQGNGRFDKKELMGRVVAYVQPVAETIDDRFNPGETKAVARMAYVVVLDKPRAVYTDVLEFGAAIVPGLTDRSSAPSDVVVGRIGKGSAQPGRSAAYLLNNPEPPDLELAREFMAEFATRLEDTGEIVIDVDAVQTADNGEPF